MASGLAIRLALWAGTRGTGLQIDDETDYHRLAVNVLHGHGYCFEPGTPTSIRPPLYPAFLVGLYFLGGEANFPLVRAVQIVLAAVNVFFLYRLGCLAFDRRAGLLGAAVFWLYPSWIAFDFLLLTEVLFTLLLTLFALAYLKLLRDG